MSNVGSRKRKQSNLAAATKKTRTGGQVSVLRPKINRPLTDKFKPGDQVFRLVRTMRQNAVSNLSPTVTVVDNGGKQITAYIYFQLDQLNGFANYAACFAEYRIAKATLIFIPRMDNGGAGPLGATGATASSVYTLGWYHDDSGIGLTATEQANENPWINRQGYRQVPFDREVRVPCYPSPVTGLVGPGGAIEAALGSPGQWISTSNSDLQHYGLKYRVYDFSPATNPVINAGSLYVQYHVEFRQPK